MERWRPINQLELFFTQFKNHQKVVWKRVVIFVKGWYIRNQEGVSKSVALIGMWSHWRMVFRIFTLFDALVACCIGVLCVGFRNVSEVSVQLCTKPFIAGPDWRLWPNSSRSVSFEENYDHGENEIGHLWSSLNLLIFIRQNKKKLKNIKKGGKKSCLW